MGDLHIKFVFDHLMPQIINEIKTGRVNLPVSTNKFGNSQWIYIFITRTLRNALWKYPEASETAI